MTINTLTSDKQTTCKQDFVFDCRHPGKPLIISFSFAHWDETCTFDFWGRLKKIEGLLAQPFNRIYLRDPQSSWYHYGIEGLGHNIDEIVSALKEEVVKLCPSEVITIGQSMGGYAALMFGALLHVDKVVAFAPQAFIDVATLKSYNDKRYLSRLEEINKHQNVPKYLDIVSLYQQTPHQPKVHVIFGTKGGNQKAETVHLDALHAFRLEQLPKCQLHPYSDVDHLIVKHLSSSKRIDDLLLTLIFNTTAKKETYDEPSIGWQKWVFRNLFAGCKVDTLVKNVSAGNSAEKGAVIQALRNSSKNGYIQAAKDMKYTLDKRNWLINTVGQLAALDEGAYQRLKAIKTPDFITFVDQYYSKHKPVILTEGITHWSALGKWSPHYFSDKFGNNEVEIQYGRSQDPHYERHAPRYKKKMLLREYCRMVTEGGQSNDYYLTANNNKESLGGLDSLFDDVGDFGVGYRDLKSIKRRSHLWFGPKGVFTPLHHDLTNNMLIQIYGRKKITLIPAFQVNNVYNDRHVYSATNFPQVDKKRFPLLDKATTIEFILNPGEAVFIPIGWWHCVEGLDVSMSISFTDFNVKNDFFKSFPRV